MTVLAAHRLIPSPPGGSRRWGDRFTSFTCFGGEDENEDVFVLVELVDECLPLLQQQPHNSLQVRQELCEQSDLCEPIEPSALYKVCGLCEL